MFQVILRNFENFQFVGILLVGCANCWPNAFYYDQKCGLSESISLFDKTISEKDGATKEDLVFMTEFARFMNYKAPQLLQVHIDNKWGVTNITWKQSNIVCTVMLNI